MKIFAIAATALVAAVAYAAPAPIEDRQFQAQITFSAGPVQFTQSFPTDGSVVQISTYHVAPSIATKALYSDS